MVFRLTNVIGACSSQWAALLVACGLCSVSEVSAQYEDGRRPPVVIGPSGHPYGPTQAEYQYQLRYGRPSPNAQPGDMRYVNGYPGGGAGPAIPVYGPDCYRHGPVTPFNPYVGGYHYQAHSVYGPGLQIGVYTPFGAYVTAPPPAVFAPQPPQLPFRPNDPLDDPAFRGDLPSIAPALARPNVPPPILEPSTPEQQIRCVRAVDQGDQDLRRIRYQAAALHYKNAVAAARDQATPRFRLALTYVGRSMFPEAIEQYKLGLTLDPAWPQRSEQLIDLLGDDNTMARNLLVHRVAEWVNQDIRDPERLFLLVAVLHQNGDQRAQTVLQTALLLAGEQPHLVAFLPPANPVQQQPVALPQQQPVGQPGVPEANPLPVPGPQPGQPATPAGPVLPLPGQPAGEDIPPPPSGEPVNTIPEEPNPPAGGPLLPLRET